MGDRAARPIVVTGLGVVTPLGIGVENTWRAICAGESGIGLITMFDPTVRMPELPEESNISYRDC